VSDLELLDRAYYATNQYFIERGFGPHYTELANDLGLEMEEGRALLRELVESGIPAWQHPGTDYVVSFPPFNSMPTQYRVSVDGEQKWFAQ
jgi:hypothetical protein